jgi:dipeptidyl-peptidase-4
MTLMALLKAPDVFSVGVAGAPVTDWDGYDTAYTERYMGTPENNPDGYRESSVLTYVANLRCRLLLVHGMTDENVHFRHTARLIVALTAAGRDYELLLFPEERHMPRDPQGLAYQEQRVIDFLLRHLRG